MFPNGSSTFLSAVANIIISLVAFRLFPLMPLETTKTSAFYSQGINKPFFASSSFQDLGLPPVTEYFKKLFIVRDH